MNNHMTDNVEKYAVIGAGEISISETNNHNCGGIRGFALDVSFTQFGWAGGVISTEDAVLLANHILHTVKISEK